ncbi:MAG: polysaccharide deacetylase family protein [Magnetococcales bacterium]|nr:polysaccharide deacetylase family protein [Magnetococcales bacterium]
MKKLLLHAVRSLHLVFLNPALPTRLAIYLHALEAENYRAFEEFVTYFRGLGYRFCRVDEFHATSDKVILLSFDDNYRSWFDAIDLLEQLEVKALFFINTLPTLKQTDDQTISGYYDRIAHHGERIPLTMAQIQALHQGGHTIGCHGHSHFNMAQLPFEQAVQEIQSNRQQLETIIGEAVNHLSYPFGMRRHFTPALRQWCRENGFKTVFNAIPGLQHTDNRDCFDVNRTRWHLHHPIKRNVEDLSIDGRWFEKLTKKSAVG